MAVDSTTFSSILVEQLDFYLAAHLLPRLEGLTDEEFFWEPVDGCWSIRPDSAGGWRADDSQDRAADGSVVDPATTIGWRLSHIAA